MKQMRLAGVSTVEEANRYWEEVFLPQWEQRFTVEPRRKEDAHRERGAEQRLEEILSVRVGRQVSNDYTVSWRATTWALGREQARPGMRGVRVEVEQRLDGSVWWRFRRPDLKLMPCRARGRQLLPAYGLQDLPPAKPTLLTPTTLGTGSFYPAKDRNFLLCVDRKSAAPGRGEGAAWQRVVDTCIQMNINRIAAGTKVNAPVRRAR